MPEDKLLVIVGPTASGKTSLAIYLAKKYNGEIVCADSMTIYKHMDIGTAKPTNQERKVVKHYLLDLVEPGGSFSAAEFKKKCFEAVKQIRKSAKLPIIVGGSGLYIDAYLYDYSFREKNMNIDTKNMTETEIIQKTKEAYPEIFKTIVQTNVRRMAQLLERGPSSKKDRSDVKIECKIIGLMPNKLLLRQNIEIRTDQMLNKGFVQEVEYIRNKYGKNCKSLNSVGYKQICDYLDSKSTIEEAREAIVKATRDLAKRQYTWFKRNPQIKWVENLEQGQELGSKYLI